MSNIMVKTITRKEFHAEYPKIFQDENCTVTVGEQGELKIIDTKTQKFICGFSKSLPTIYKAIDLSKKITKKNNKIEKAKKDINKIISKKKK